MDLELPIKNVLYDPARSFKFLSISLVKILILCNHPKWPA